MLGYKRIPEQWKSGIPNIADTKFAYTDFTFRTIVESTEKRALATIRKHGGRVEGDTVTVKLQKAAPAKLEVWDDYGNPAERIAVADARWKWAGEWRLERGSRFSASKGAEASIDFEGTGVILAGPYLPTGGRADIYLDGKPPQTVDVFSDEKNRKGGESVWHAFKLKPGRHSLRLVVRGEPYPGSGGADVGIDDLIVFR
jgi:hypothetical protein